MTQKTFKYGKYPCKSYKKPAGKGYEVGFTLSGQQIFVGNFIHAKEANAWYSIMNNEMRKFTKRFAPTPKTPKAWIGKFLSNLMYKSYYTHLDRQFTKYQRGYTQAVRKEARRFTHYMNKPAPTHLTTRRAA